MMKALRHLPLLLGSALLASTAAAQLPAPPATLGFSAERLARIDRVMQQYVDSGKVAGVVTLVLRHGKVAHRGAYCWADKEGGRRMTSDALFRIASQSKAITSVAAMMLVEEGTLRLNEPVSRWIPSFAGARVATASDTGLGAHPGQARHHHS